MEDFYIVLFCLVMSGGFLLFGFITISGRYRGWYFGLFSARTRDIPYISLPIAIFFFLPVIGSFFYKTDHWIMSVIPNLAISVAVITILCSIIKPSIFKPQWLRFLENNHKDILPLIEDEINKVGIKEWTQLTKTQDKLEKWVVEFRQEIYTGQV